MTNPEAATSPATRSSRKRLVILVVVLALLFSLGEYYNLAERFDPLALRDYIQSMGAMGIVLFLLLFCVMLLLSVPGMIFMVAAGLIWGNVQGSIIALLGVNLATAFSFLLVRRWHGSGFEAGAVRNKTMQRMLAGLEKRPVKTVAILRCLFSTAPALNYGFALSGLSTREHTIGTLVGSVLPVVGIVVGADWLLKTLFL
ncbi:MAG: VTT domain-containing protein [Gammaproteobacteria bacterium]|nr:VTT domain-containing protein [Gammaproteobacteria bacterium]NND38100.1 TVP38/TMEM64 family protein [Pseudomonadales bacterium]MBT8150356.1 VTT domain-containing protein [Gammaproteobacteria bacterium]NNL11475.1 TVP38/TMEM64 family protein [Pseudomonadales bacterium]NNM11256.1 TVP38/TMEM64 family protein [Pseudomonadales bacterium]